MGLKQRACSLSLRLTLVRVLSRRLSPVDGQGCCGHGEQRV